MILNARIWKFMYDRSIDWCYVCINEYERANKLIEMMYWDSLWTRGMIFIQNVWVLFFLKKCFMEVSYVAFLL